MAITIISNYPAANSTDIVLQSTITVTFSEAVSTGYVDSNTFVVYSVGDTIIKDAGGALPKGTDTHTKYAETDYVEGTFTFASGDTAVIFSPSKPLRPNTQYTVMVAGYDTGQKNSSRYIRALAGSYLAKTVRWKFTTGELMLETPPNASTEVTFDEILAQLGDDYVDSNSQLYTVSPTNDGINFVLVDDVLFTYTFTKDIVTPSGDLCTVTVFDIDNPAATEIELPTTYEVADNGRTLKIKFI